MDFDRIRQGKTQIMIQSRFSLQDIDCSYSPIRVSFTEQEKLCIENEWNEVIKYKQFLFDGCLFHIQNQDFCDSKIRLSMCKSSFKEYVGTDNKEFKRLFGPNKIIRPISVGTMIITSDNKWIAGRKLRSINNEGFYTLIAGYMDPTKDLINSKPDPFYAVKREMKEESGVVDNNIDSLICIGLVCENQPYLAFVSSLNLSYAEFNSLIPQEKEFMKLEQFSLTKKAIENFILRNHNRINPHALANLLMFLSLG